MEFEAPLTRWRERIRPEWLDGNGHMNVVVHGMRMFVNMQRGMET